MTEQAEFVCVWCGLNAGKHESRFFGSLVIHHYCLDVAETTFREGKITVAREKTARQRMAYNADKVDALKMALGQ